MRVSCSVSERAATLSARVLEGDPRALARAISLIEDEAPEGAELVRRIFAQTGRAYLIGITGAPGSGKSTLVDRLTAAIRAKSQTVGIVAVDPTSPFSGGAILGDRVRMQAHAGDAGVFIRSMATRGHLGGLARATSEVALVLDAAGKDVVIIETVGVGQDEIDIVRTADVSVVTIVPGTGDEVQALKAGIMEIADIFVVNKADREGADRTVASIEANLSLQTFGPTSGVRRSSRPRRRRGTGYSGPARCHRAVSDAYRGVAGRPASGAGRVPAARAPRAALPSPRRAAGVGRWRVRSNPGSDRGARGRSIYRGGRHHEESVMKATLDHIGIAVSDLGEALRFYRDALGLEVESPEEVPSQRVRAHFIPAGESALELLEATDDTSPIAKYTAKRGPGLHHITLRVDDIVAALATLKQRGVRLIDEAPRPGAHGSLVAFIHPSSAHGVLVELKQVLVEQ